MLKSHQAKKEYEPNAVALTGATPDGGVGVDVDAGVLPAPLPFDTAFTRAFTDRFIGTRPEWKWPKKDDLGPERLKGLLTFTQLLLSGAQTGDVEAGPHPEALNATLLEDVKKFLHEFHLGDKIGWPQICIEEIVPSTGLDDHTLRMAEAALLIERLIEASASNLGGGGDGPVKTPIKPNSIVRADR